MKHYILDKDTYIQTIDVNGVDYDFYIDEIGDLINPNDIAWNKDKDKFIFSTNQTKSVLDSEEVLTDQEVRDIVRTEDWFN